MKSGNMSATGKILGSFLEFDLPDTGLEYWEESNIFSLKRWARDRGSKVMEFRLFARRWRCVLSCFCICWGLENVFVMCHFIKTEGEESKRESIRNTNTVVCKNTNTVIHEEEKTQKQSHCILMFWWISVIKCT